MRTQVQHRTYQPLGEVMDRIAAHRPASACPECGGQGVHPSTPPIPADFCGSLIDGRVMQYNKAELLFCTCEAGQRYQAMIESKVAQHRDVATVMQEVQESAWEQRRQRIFAESGVRDGYLNLTFQRYLELCKHDPGRAALISAIGNYRKHGYLDTEFGRRYGILAYGPTDVGKTGALTPLFLSYVREGHAGLWVQYNDLLAALKRFEDGQVDERVEALKAVPFLFIDDLGDPATASLATDYTRDVMFRIIDYRHGYQKPTFVTSNLHPDHMSGHFHERTTRRLAELCAVVEVTGTPMRDLLATAVVSTGMCSAAS